MPGREGRMVNRHLEEVAQALADCTRAARSKGASANWLPDAEHAAYTALNRARRDWLEAGY
jgi:hypothetical protein